MDHPAPVRAQLEFRRRIVAGLEKQLGPEHPQTLACIEIVANLLRDTGDQGTAEALYRKILEARERTLGFDHADSAVRGSADTLWLLICHEPALLTMSV